MAYALTSVLCTLLLLLPQCNGQTPSIIGSASVTFPVSCLAWQPNRTLLAIATGPSVTAVDFHTGTFPWNVQTNILASSLLFDPVIANQFYVGGNSSISVAFDVLVFGAVPMRLQYHSSLIVGLALNPLNRTELLSASDDGKWAGWHTQTGVQLFNRTLSLNVTALAASGQEVALGHAAGGVNYFSETTMAGTRSAVAYSVRPTALAFDPTNATRLAVGCIDGTMGILVNGVPAGGGRFIGHTDRITAIAFHPQNSSVVASASLDNTVRLWHSESYALLCVLPHTAGVTALAFHLYNGSVLATGTNSKVYQWSIACPNVVLPSPGPSPLQPPTLTPSPRIKTITPPPLTAAPTAPAPEAPPRRLNSVVTGLVAGSAGVVGVATCVLCCIKFGGRVFGSAVSSALAENRAANEGADDTRGHGGLQDESSYESEKTDGHLDVDLTTAAESC